MAAWSGGESWSGKPRSARGWRHKPEAAPRRRASRHFASLHEAGLRLVELIERLCDVVPDRLDARDRVRVELRIIWAARRTASDLEDCVELVRMHLALLVGPRALPRELTILRPDSVGERKRANLVARHGGVDAHHVARDLLLHNGVRVLVEHCVPERVVAELEPLIG